MKAVGRTFLALMALTCVGSTCSDNSTSQANGLRCTTSGRVHVAVDYEGEGGYSSPLLAVSTYLSREGSGLPTEGYEVDSAFQDEVGGTDGTPPSVEDPRQGTPPPAQSQTVVHRSGETVDGALEVTNYGAGWRVSGGTWCPEAQQKF